VFAGICLVIGNAVENLGVSTGFPFGRYYFVDLMGPKLFHVPILLGLAYIGMAYVSFTLAQLILGRTQARIAGPHLIALPLLASFIMTSWDFAQDPVWSTVLHGWVWLDGGRWFGVPISNFAGWLANLFLIYLLFALYLRRLPVAPIAVPRAHWRAPLIFYALCAAGNVLQALPRHLPAIVTDSTGKPWRVADITRASALVSIFMGSFVIFAWIRMPREGSGAKD
jgi:putative membrane protein